LAERTPLSRPLVPDGQAGMTAARSRRSGSWRSWSEP